MSLPEGPTPDNRATPYQITLAAFIVPWPQLLLLNSATGLAFSLIAGWPLAAVWVACLSLGDAILLRIYRRLHAAAALADSDQGLRRLALIGCAPALLWMSGPATYTVLSHSPLGFAFVAAISITLVALAVSTGRNARGLFLILAIAPVTALAICVLAVFGAAAGAGVLLAIAITAAMLFLIGAGTNRTVAEWNAANRRTEEAMTSLRGALETSEAAERRFHIAAEIADLYVFEADLIRRTYTSTGADAEVFDRLYGGDGFWENPFRSTHADDLPWVKAAWKAYVAGEAPYKIEHRAHGLHGDIWIAATAEYVRDDQGRPVALIGALRDITERKNAEVALTAALEAAEAGSRAKSQFLSVISHETRTPLNGVLGMVQVMERDDLTPAQRDRLGVVRRSGEALHLLLNNLLDLSALEAGEMAFETAEVDIAHLAETAMSLFETAAAQKDLKLTLEVLPEACGRSAGDPGRVGQVLYALISNAVKFTDTGSVDVTVSRQGDTIRIDVADTGVGMTAEGQPGLFETFFQADSSLTRRHGGCGVGLAICRQLAAGMGGNLVFESRPSEGSTFTVTLHLPALRNAGAAAEGLANAEAEDGRPLNVLVAEDNPVNQLVLKTLLQQIGIEATIVEDGAQAVSAWRKGAWDLVLMDIQMPVMDGVSACRAIRSEEASASGARTPIIAVTANAMAEQVRTYQAAGIDDVVTKPVQITRLVEAIEGALALGAVAEPLAASARD